MKSNDNIGIVIITITVILILAAGILAFPLLFLRGMGCPPPDDRPTTTAYESRVMTRDDNGNVDFSALYEINDDIVGWLTLGDTETHDNGIDMPVVQADDNVFYSEHDFDKMWYYTGTLFADCGNRFSGHFSDNTVIYGVSSGNSNDYAGAVMRYVNGTDTLTPLEYYKKYPTITFETPNEKSIWKIFAAAHLNENPSDGETYPYAQTDFADEYRFETYILDIMERSVLWTDVDLQYGDKLLTIAVRYNPYSYDKRYSDTRVVVFARQVRGGESENVDVGNAKLNPKSLDYREDVSETQKTEYVPRNWDASLLKGRKYPDEHIFEGTAYGEYSVYLRVPESCSDGQQLEFPKAYVEVYSPYRLMASQAFSVPDAGVISCDCDRNVELRMFQGNYLSLISVFVPYTENGVRYYETHLYWTNLKEMYEIPEIRPEVLSPDDLYLDNFNILNITGVNGEYTAYRIDRDDKTIHKLSLNEPEGSVSVKTFDIPFKINSERGENKTDISPDDLYYSVGYAYCVAAELDAENFPDSAASDITQYNGGATFLDILKSCTAGGKIDEELLAQSAKKVRVYGYLDNEQNDNITYYRIDNDWTAGISGSKVYALTKTDNTPLGKHFTAARNVILMLWNAKDSYNFENVKYTFVIDHWFDDDMDTLAYLEAECADETTLDLMMRYLNECGCDLGGFLGVVNRYQ
ncbi:MAG: class B sortase [Ruminiclostridium sp.]|nr:class B sortase [Ruminiclostridium sp.]